MEKFTVIQWSDDMRRAMLEADHIVRKSRQDRAFERNQILKQKLNGIVIALLAIFIAWFLSAKYGQFEYFYEAILFVGFGCYMILTDKNYSKEVKDGKGNTL